MKITVNFSCEGNFKLFWVKFGIKCIPLRVNIDFNLFKIACCALAMSYCSQFVDPEIIHLPLFNYPQSHFNLKTRDPRTASHPGPRLQILLGPWSAPVRFFKNFARTNFWVGGSQLKTEVRYALGLFDIRFGFWLFYLPTRALPTDLVKIPIKGSRFILSTRWSWEYKKSSSKTGIGFGWSQ